jgi:hypothetical protein
MKALFGILVFLMLFASASAQTTAIGLDTTKANSTMARQLTSADTVRALQRLFKKRRIMGGVLVATAGTFFAVGVSDVVENGGNAAFFTGASAYVFVTLVSAIYTAPLYIPGLIIGSKYSRKKEAAVLTQYNTSKTIPDKYKRKLKPGLFKQPTAK